MDYKLTFEDGSEAYLTHYGIRGQKWGDRRFQNEDGTLTPEGKARYYNEYGNLTQEGRALGKRMDDRLPKHGQYRSAVKETNKKLSMVKLKNGSELKKRFPNEHVTYYMQDGTVAKEEKARELVFKKGIGIAGIGTSMDVNSSVIKELKQKQQDEMDKITREHIEKNAQYFLTDLGDEVTPESLAFAKKFIKEYNDIYD